MAIGDWRSYVIRKNASALSQLGSVTDRGDPKAAELRNKKRAILDKYNPQIKPLRAKIANLVVGGNAYNREKPKLDRLVRNLNSELAPINAQIRQVGFRRALKPNVQSTGTRQPATSVVDATRNVPPAPDLPPVQGENPADLAGFARQRGYMGQQTQNTPTGNVALPRPDYMLPRDSQGNVIPQSPPTGDVPLPNVPKQTQQVTEEARQQASQPTPQQKQRTGPPPKRMTTAQLNQQAQQRRQQQSNNPPDPPKDAQGNPIPPNEMPSINQQLIQQNRRMQDKFLQDMQRTVQRSAKSGRQRRKDAKAQAKQQKQQAKQQARQQKTQQRMAQQQQRQQEREAKRQAKQNPRAGGQLVRRNPDSMNPNSRLVPRGQANTQSRLRPRQPRKIPLAKSDELSKSIKDILRR